MEHRRSAVGQAFLRCPQWAQRNSVYRRHFEFARPDSRTSQRQDRGLCATEADNGVCPNGFARMQGRSRRHGIGRSKKGRNHGIADHEPDVANTGRGFAKRRFSFNRPGRGRLEGSHCHRRCRHCRSLSRLPACTRRAPGPGRRRCAARTRDGLEPGRHQPAARARISRSDGGLLPRRLPLACANSQEIGSRAPISIAEM